VLIIQAVSSHVRPGRCRLRWLGLPSALVGVGGGKEVGAGSGFDDGPLEGEPVEDRCAKSRVCEGFRSPREGVVAGDRGVLLVASGEDMEEDFGAASVVGTSEGSVSSWVLLVLDRFSGGLSWYLEFHRGHPAVCSLPAFAVVSPLDPGHDGEPQVLLCRPFLSVEDVFCWSAKNDSIAALSPHAPTRPTDPVNPLLLSV
jgi:hypothetical protein